MLTQTTLSRHLPSDACSTRGRRRETANVCTIINCPNSTLSICIRTVAGGLPLANSASSTWMWILDRFWMDLEYGFIHSGGARYFGRLRSGWFLCFFQIRQISFQFSEVLQDFSAPLTCHIGHCSFSNGTFLHKTISCQGS